MLWLKTCTVCNAVANWNSLISSWRAIRPLLLSLKSICASLYFVITSTNFLARIACWEQEMGTWRQTSTHTSRSSIDLSAWPRTRDTPASFLHVTCWIWAPVCLVSCFTSSTFSKSHNQRLLTTQIYAIMSWIKGAFYSWSRFVETLLSDLTWDLRIRRSAEALSSLLDSSWRSIAKRWRQMTGGNRHCGCH